MVALEPRKVPDLESGNSGREKLCRDLMRRLHCEQQDMALADASVAMQVWVGNR
jgi:hypothetical protein